MNIQGSNMAERRQVRNTGGARRIVLVLQFGLLLISAAFMANTYIYFNQKITEADRSIRNLKTELANVEREIDSYRLQYEKYSAWPHIRESIRRFNLPLRPATPDQNRHLAMIPPSLAPAITITFRDNVSTPAPTRVVKPAEVRRQANSVRNRDRNRVQHNRSRYPAFRYTHN